MPTRRTRPREAVVEIPTAVEGVSVDAPLYTQLYRRFRESILAGGLKPGARLPSARTLATDLRVSRNTVESAFRQLTAEGFVVRRVGAGTVVAESTRQEAPFGPRGRRPAVERIAPAPGSSIRPRLSNRGRLLAELGAAEIATDHPLGPCSTDVVGFPVRTWSRVVARRARRGGNAPFEPATPCGVTALRVAIAEHVRLTRGVRAEPEQVVVVNSTQQAVDLAARLLLDPGSTALVEEPGYPGARAAMAAAGAVIGGVPVDPEGVVTERFGDWPDARLLYVTPSHQFPLGVTMSLARRLAVLRWAAARGAWVFEDDYDSEFRYEGRPIAALQGLDRGARVLYVGTFNKILFPGLRLAYLIVPPALVDGFAATRRITDGFSAPFMQAVLADFMIGGHFSAYLRQAREHYSACRDLLVERITAMWSGVRLGPSDTGLHLIVHLEPGQDDVAIAAAAPPNGVGVAPLSRYYAGKSSERGLLLSYGAAGADQIPRSVAALAPWLAGKTRRR